MNYKKISNLIKLNNKFYSICINKITEDLPLMKHIIFGIIAEQVIGTIRTKVRIRNEHVIGTYQNKD